MASVVWNYGADQDRFIELGCAARGKNGIGDGFSICCNFSIMSRWIDQLFNQNPTNCCNFPSFPPGEREKVGHAGSEEGRKENCSKRWDSDWTADQSSMSRWRNCSKQRNCHRCHFFPWLTPRALVVQYYIKSNWNGQVIAKSRKREIHFKEHWLKNWCEAGWHETKVG